MKSFLHFYWSSFFIVEKKLIRIGDFGEEGRKEGKKEEVKD